MANVIVYDLEVFQIDFKITFLNGDFENIIFLEQPNGNIVASEEKIICKL
jgi:hypothetical protein